MRCLRPTTWLATKGRSRSARSNAERSCSPDCALLWLVRLRRLLRLKVRFWSCKNPHEAFITYSGPVEAAGKRQGATARATARQHDDDVSANLIVLSEKLEERIPEWVFLLTLSSLPIDE